MKRQGPFLTLLAGVLLAVVVGVLDVRANSSDNVATGAAPAATTTPSQSTEAPSAATSPSASPSTTKARLRANYAGHTAGREATVAVAVRDGGAVAYVCDGRRAEAWLLGSATDGRLTLSGEEGGSDRIAGTYGGGRATGTVWLGNKKWAFSVPTVHKPYGLYRVDATIRGVRYRGGWIVLPSGQTGVASTRGTAAPAPLLDPSATAVMIDGTRVPFWAISGVGGGGF
jgi:hypothetical protein